MSRLRAIRRHCMGCVGIGAGGSYRDIADCTAGPDGNGYQCLLFPFRMGTNPFPPGDRRNHKTTLIHRFCRECMGGSPSLVRECKSTSCPLWGYRCAPATTQHFRPRTAPTGPGEAKDTEEAVGVDSVAKTRRNGLSADLCSGVPPRMGNVQQASGRFRENSREKTT
jgi:hypothetical protein